MAYFQYTVKYLCGEGDNGILAKGRYFTAINIHNPYDFLQRTVCWKVVSPGDRRNSHLAGALGAGQGSRMRSFR